MYAQLPAEKFVPAEPHGSNQEISPITTEISKKTQFYRFLQKEMNTVKTEAEKEAVLSILVQTKLQITVLEKEWKQIRALRRSSRSDSPAIANYYPTSRIQ